MDLTSKILDLRITRVDNVMSSCVKKLQRGVLYDLRSRHPTIDGVGLLYEEVTLIPWLVFIQISLSRYDEHRSKLSDLLSLPKEEPKELKGSRQKTLYSYYKRLGGDEVEKVMFLYVSPEEMDCNNSPILPSLHKYLTKAKNNQMHFGILSGKSKFMSFLQEQKLRTSIRASKCNES